MNVIIVNDFSFVDGGASRVAIDSAIGLSKKGHNVIFFTAVGPVSEELSRSKIKIILTDQYDILRNPNKVSAAIQGIWNKKAQKCFKDTLKLSDPHNTIIHVHSWEKSLSSSVIRQAIEADFRVVITLHDYIIACPNGGFYNYNTNEICHLAPMSKECILCNCDSRHYYHKIWRLLRQDKQRRKGFLPMGIKNYIYISDMSKNILAPFLPQDAKLYYVNNPIDIKKDENVHAGNNKSFIYIGRLSKEKGCLLFAEAAAQLGVNAVFVGEGELKDKIMNICPGAEITGWLNKEQVIEKLKSARALVFPSLWYETLGLVPLEAHAKGIPVIVSDTCSARENVKNGKTGLWFKRGNLQDLKSKIEVMLDDNLAETYGACAYKEFWDKDYSIGTHVEQLEKVYENILKRG